MEGDSVGLPIAFSLFNGMFGTIDSPVESGFYHTCRIQGCYCKPFGFTIEIIHSYELNRLINGFFFGFTIEIFHRYGLNRLIHGFSVGFTVEILYSFELNRLIDWFHLS